MKNKLQTSSNKRTTKRYAIHLNNQPYGLLTAFGVDDAILNFHILTQQRFNQMNNTHKITATQISLRQIA